MEAAGLVLAGAGGFFHFEVVGRLRHSSQATKS